MGSASDGLESSKLAVRESVVADNSSEFEAGKVPVLVSAEVSTWE
jgi:hypothetical protein